jgi:hypothetical protein
MKQTVPAPVRPLVVMALVGGLLAGVEVASPAAACASGHSDIVLGNFQNGPQPPHFYMGIEGEKPTVSARFDITIHGCASQDPVRVNWDTIPDTAADADFSAPLGPSHDLNSPPCDASSDCQTSHTVPISITNDIAEEPVAERFRFAGKTTSGRLYAPTTVPVYIVDNDGPTNRVAFGEPLASLPYRQLEHHLSARIPVFRAGPATGPTIVNFTLAGTGASPAGSGDFTPASGQVTFNDGERLKFLPFSITNDTLVEDPETITATLTSASGGAVATPSQVDFTIVDEDSDNLAPVSKFHHPKQGRIYDYNDYRIREIHTFFKDEGGSGVAKAWLALRLTRKNGRCAWYTGSGFDGGRCGAKRWLKMKPSTRFYLYRVKPLKPSIGTKIKNYRAWTRLMDGAGNKESRFQKGRNLNTFEIRRR